MGDYASGCLDRQVALGGSVRSRIFFNVTRGRFPSAGSTDNPGGPSNGSRHPSYSGFHMMTFGHVLLDVAGRHLHGGTSNDAALLPFPVLRSIP